MKLMVNSSMDFRRMENEEDPYQKRLGSVSLQNRNRPLTGRIGYRHQANNMLLARNRNMLNFQSNPALDQSQ